MKGGRGEGTSNQKLVVFKVKKYEKRHFCHEQNKLSNGPNKGDNLLENC